MYYSNLDKPFIDLSDPKSKLFTMADAKLPLQDEPSKGPADDNSFGFRFADGRFWLERDRHAASC